MLPVNPRPACAWGVTAAAGLLLAGVLMSLSATDETRVATLFETPAWQGQGALMLRRAAGGGALLLKHEPRGAVYKYDRAKRTLAPAAEEEWRQAAGPVGYCAEQFHPPPQVLRIDARVHRLFAGSREIPTAGKTVLDMRSSPSGLRVAVVSAAGPKKGSLLPFIGGGGASGQHYGQVFSLPAVAPLGRPTRLEPSGGEQLIAPCWSPDEEYVVYTDILFFYLYVVETEKPSTSQPTEVSP